MSAIDSFVDLLKTPENKARLGTFIGVLQDLVQPPKSGLDVVESNHAEMAIEQVDGKPVITVTSEFLKKLGKHCLTINMSSKLSDDCTQTIGEAAPPQRSHATLVEKGYIVFTPEGEQTRVHYRITTLDRILNVQTINLIKRNVIDAPLVAMVQEGLKEANVPFWTEGDDWPLVDGAGNASSTIIYRDRPVDVPEEMFRTVLKETLAPLVAEAMKSLPTQLPIVYTEKVVWRDRVVSVKEDGVETLPPAPAPKTVVAVVPEAVEPTEEDAESSETDKSSEAESESGEESSESSESSSETDDESSESDSSSSAEELSESSESDKQEEPTPLKAKHQTQEVDPAEESKSTLRIKGVHLNQNHTVLKSGDYVYRIIKAVGTTRLEAIGKWNPKKLSPDASNCPKGMTVDKWSNLATAMARCPSDKKSFVNLTNGKVVTADGKMLTNALLRVCAPKEKADMFGKMTDALCAQCIDDLTKTDVSKIDALGWTVAKSKLEDMFSAKELERMSKKKK